MPAAKLKKLLDSRGVKYVSIQHSPAFTASEVAASAHVSGRGFIKSVIVKIDEELSMVGLPANRKIELSDLRDALLCEEVELAREDEFKQQFPDCEVGAMPPFGNLYGVRTLLALDLVAEPEITFNAGTHREVIKMPFVDYMEIAKPLIVELALV